MSKIEKQRIQLFVTDSNKYIKSFAESVDEGLSSDPKKLSFMFFYDEAGSHLFEQICVLDEYYLTRAETEILQIKSKSIAEMCSSDTLLVELGSGSSNKTRLLISAFLKYHSGLHYIPIDISRSILEESTMSLLNDFPKLEITGLVAEYSEALEKLNIKGIRQPKLIIWLGSSVGNFTKIEAVEFLNGLRKNMAPKDKLLIGIDLKKDRNVLISAYDDKKGVTAQFNLNLLKRINTELGGNFDVNNFKHMATFNEEESRIEMHIVSKKDQTVKIEAINREIKFKTNETIHTENSYKYNYEQIENLALETGFILTKQWTDSHKHFSLNLFSLNPKQICTVNQ